MYAFISYVAYRYIRRLFIIFGNNWNSPNKIPYLDCTNWVEENRVPNVFPSIKKPAIIALSSHVITIPGSRFSFSKMGYVGHGQPSISPNGMQDKEAEKKIKKLKKKIKKLKKEIKKLKNKIFQHYNLTQWQWYKKTIKVIFVQKWTGDKKHVVDLLTRKVNIFYLYLGKQKMSQISAIYCKQTVSLLEILENLQYRSI